MRIGESLWFTWEGDEYQPAQVGSHIYYTNGHVDLEKDVVKGSLASLIQRDGIAFSLGNSYFMVESATVSHLAAGYADGYYHPTIADPDGLSVRHEIELEGLFDITIVEVSE